LKREAQAPGSVLAEPEDEGAAVDYVCGRILGSLSREARWCKAVQEADRLR
jgi:hypothetical protein